MSKVQFLDELPPSEKGGGFREFWTALDANPGKWAVWPGKAKAVRTAARQKSRNGAQYEGHQRGGIGYMRRIEKENR